MMPEYTPTEPPEGSIITDAGRGYPITRGQGALWFRAGWPDGKTWEQVLAWHQEAIDDPDDDTVDAFSPVLMLPLLSGDPVTREELREILTTGRFENVDEQLAELMPFIARAEAAQKAAENRSCDCDIASSPLTDEAMDELVWVGVKALILSAEVPTGMGMRLLSEVPTIREKVDADVVVRAVIEELNRQHVIAAIRDGEATRG